jgi:Domain of unknown function (DUF4440)
MTGLVPTNGYFPEYRSRNSVYRLAIGTGCPPMKTLSHRSDVHRIAVGHHHIGYFPDIEGPQLIRHAPDFGWIQSHGFERFVMQPDSGLASYILYLVSGKSEAHNMKILFCLGVLALFVQPIFAKCPPQAKDASALVQLEQNWAAALEVRDADAVGCLLADEFQDADPSGALHDRTETLAQIPHRRPGKNILSELTPHVFGDFGYIRGLATLVNGDGKTIARVRFTDVYVYRDYRWQAVAGQESLLPEAAK